MTTVLEEFRWQARNAFDWLEHIVEDVTPEQALWQPPGRTNTIAQTYAHIVRNVDEDVNQRLFRRPRLNQGAWQGRTGLAEGTDDWEQPAIDWCQLREYGRAISGFIVETVDALTEEDLRRMADLSTPDLAQWHGIDIIRLSVGGHVRMHGGEIACIKGLQGAKGYRSGLDVNRP
jgi:hypothetical protein